MSAMTTNERPGPAGLSPRFLIVGLAAFAVGLLAPLLIGSYTGGQLLGLALIEVACLLAVGLGWLVLARRLEASRRALWTLSRRDELTGVGNYRALQERLGQEISRHARRGREFALILIDLDGFKQVNEEFGHLEGDRVLAEIGAALGDEVRDEDSVFRQGGDEFAVIAPEANGEEAEEVAARLRDRVRDCGVGGLPVTASTGIASFPADGRTADQLTRVADLALLGTKQGGGRSDRGHVIDVSRDVESAGDAVDEMNGGSA
jgi:diguanylate cyclase (GGDEF)-like protein